MGSGFNIKESGFTANQFQAATKHVGCFACQLKTEFTWFEKRNLIMCPQTIVTKRSDQSLAWDRKGNESKENKWELTQI